jgi:hypothetical protein
MGKLTPVFPKKHLFWLFFLLAEKQSRDSKCQLGRFGLKILRQLSFRQWAARQPKLALVAKQWASKMAGL